MNCECINWNITEECRNNRNFRFLHHHPKCEKFTTEEFGRLFYLDRATRSWLTVPSDLSKMINVENLKDGESSEIEFKRVDMTQYEFEELAKKEQANSV